MKDGEGVTKNLQEMIDDRARKILEVRKIMKQREEVRSKGDFHASDMYREKLQDMGVIVLDQKHGPSGWKFANGQSKKLPSGISIPESSAKKRKRNSVDNVSKDKKVAGDVSKTTLEQKRNLTALNALLDAEEFSNANIVKGVKIDDISAGRAGPVASPGNKVKVHYVGRLQGSNGKDGKIFDCSSKKPFTFKLGKGEVIQGWDIGVTGMQIGGKRRLTIPPEKAYGRRGAPPKIPGNATLIFEVTLVDILK